MTEQIVSGRTRSYMTTLRFPVSKLIFFLCHAVIVKISKLFIYQKLNKNRNFHKILLNLPIKMSSALLFYLTKIGSIINVNKLLFSSEFNYMLTCPIIATYVFVNDTQADFLPIINSTISSKMLSVAHSKSL